MQNSYMKKLISNIVVCMLILITFNSCITSDVPVITTNQLQVVYPYTWHNHVPPPPPKRPIYVCPPLRNPYKPVWQQRPDVKPRHNGFGNMNRKPIDRPRNIINLRNKNFGGRR